MWTSSGRVEYPGLVGRQGTAPAQQQPRPGTAVARGVLRLWSGAGYR